jgi:hypothetical protein
VSQLLSRPIGEHLRCVAVCGVALGGHWAQGLAGSQLSHVLYLSDSLNMCHAAAGVTRSRRVQCLCRSTT